MRLRGSSALGRAALLWGGLIFLCSLLALNVILERGRPQLRDPDYGFKLAHFRACRQADPDRPLVLMLGSSRTLFGFRPELLPSCPCADGRPPLVFNFGLNGMGAPLYELLLVRRLREEGIRPDWLFIEVLPALLQITYAAEVPTFIKHLAGKDLSVVRRYSPIPQELYRQWGQNHLVPWYSYRFSLLSSFAPTWLPPACRENALARGLNRLGWLAEQDPANADQQRPGRLEHTREEYFEFMQHLSISEGPDRALRELLDFCRRKRIKVALYLMPEGPVFRSWYRPVTHQALNGYLTRLQREYGVPVIDARDWLAGEGDFYDSHHLLPRAAAAFTQRFGREALQPLLAGAGRSSP
jgi:hypothetical protein